MILKLHFLVKMEIVCPLGFNMHMFYPCLYIYPSLIFVPLLFIMKKDRLLPASPKKQWCWIRSECCLAIPMERRHSKSFSGIFYCLYFLLLDGMFSTNWFKLVGHSMHYMCIAMVQLSKIKTSLNFSAFQKIRKVKGSIGHDDSLVT